MSAELLRQAAAKMRETAQAAHEEAPDLAWGPPVKVYDGIYSLDLGPATHPDADSYGVGEDCRMPREIARYIAAFPPPVALAVADWLDAVANRAEKDGSDPNIRAEIVARAYLREQSC